MRGFARTLNQLSKNTSAEEENKTKATISVYTWDKESNNSREGIVEQVHYQQIMNELIMQKQIRNIIKRTNDKASQ